MSSENRTLRTFGCSIALAAIVTGCGGQFSAIIAPGGFNNPSAMITWVIVTPARFHAGETVQVEVGFRNPTSRPIRVHFASGCVTSYVVQNTAGEVVAPGGFACTDMVQTIVFDPGETGTTRFAWDGTARPGQALPPGDYRVIGDLAGQGAGQPSPPINIEILAP
jgi:Intracellular proteinase inhibitor